MKYRKDRYGNEISVLGYGCMRFTQKSGKIDIDKAAEEVRLAYENGVNYFDTAYAYPGNETAVGEIMERLGIRDKVNIATKLPHYFLKRPEDAENYFKEELRRLRTDYVDYYLMHMLTDIKAWERIKELGITEWLDEKNASGQIRQVGFSYHGNSDMFCELLDAYDWDFCQIQYNYLDEHSQAGRTGLEAAYAKGIPVIIMEPLRGGRLVSKLPEKAKKMFSSHEYGWSPAAWSFRWLWNQPAVTCVLSGMNSKDMIMENIATANGSDAGTLTSQDMEFLEKIKAEINSKVKVGCTGCRYCMPCPNGVDIPGIFAAYNSIYSESIYSGFREYFMCTELRKDSTAASKCVKCGKCELHCPQGIEIRKELANAGRILENPVYKIAAKAVKTVYKY